MKDIPQEWDEVLKNIQQVFPGAIIAGGALRDLILDVPIKDVDIFIPVECFEFDTVAAMFPKKLCRNDDVLNSEPWLHPDHEYGRTANKEDTGRNIHVIYQWESETTKYDFIFCSPEAADVNTFDINICQVSYDGTTINSTEAFLKGTVERHIQVLNVNRTDRNKKRMDRMRTKFPDFTFTEA